MSQTLSQSAAKAERPPAAESLPRSPAPGFTAHGLGKFYDRILPDSAAPAAADVQPDRRQARRSWPQLSCGAIGLASGGSPGRSSDRRSATSPRMACWSAVGLSGDDHRGDTIVRFGHGSGRGRPGPLLAPARLPRRISPVSNKQFLPEEDAAPDDGCGLAVRECERSLSGRLGCSLHQSDVCPRCPWSRCGPISDRPFTNSLGTVLTISAPPHLCPPPTDRRPELPDLVCVMPARIHSSVPERQSRS